MSSRLKTLTAGLSIVVLTATVQAQDNIRPAVQERSRDGVHRMVINSGPYRTVRLFADDLSPGETDSLRNLERAENEVEYVDQLQALRQQYLRNEKNLDSIRAYVQSRFYGVETDRSSSGYAGFNGGFGGGFGVNGNFGYPFYYGTPNGFAGDTGLAYGGYGSTSRVTQGVAAGIGPEGAIKDALAQTIAAQATPANATAAIQGYSSALAQAANSERLQVALGMKERRGGVAAVGFEQARKATLTLKNGDKVEGKLLRDDGDFYVVDTPAEEVSIRKSEVVRVSKAKK